MENELTETEVRKRLKIVLSVFCTTILTILIFTIIIGLVHSWDFVLTLIPVIILMVAVMGTSTMRAIPKCFQKSSHQEKMQELVEKYGISEEELQEIRKYEDDEDGCDFLTNGITLLMFAIPIAMTISNFIC